MTARNRALLVGSLLLLAGTGALLIVGNQQDASLDSPGARVASAAEVPRGRLSNEPELAPETHTPAAGRVAESFPAPEPPQAVSAAPERFGRLRLGAIDEASGVALSRIRARALSATRLADRESDPHGQALELVLTPDTYAVLVMAKGYEATELPALSIETGQTAERTSVPMRRGSARIQGTVTGDSWATDALWVELVGDGRSPCPACPDGSDSRCSLCGYSPQSTRLVVPPNGRFTFDRLVSGPYAVRLTDIQQRSVCEPKLVELEAGQARSVEIGFTTPRSVLVVVVDVDGASLASEWAPRVRRADAAAADAAAEPLEPIILEASGESAVFQCAFRTESRRIGSSTLVLPAPEPGATSVGSAMAFGSRKLGLGARKVGDDRPRKKGEELRPVAPEPTISPSYFPSSVDGDGLARFTCVPAIELTLVMTCGPFTATTAIPATRDLVRLRAALIVSKDPDTAAGTFREYEARCWR